MDLEREPDDPDTRLARGLAAAFYANKANPGMFVEALWQSDRSRAAWRRVAGAAEMLTRSEPAPAREATIRADERQTAEEAMLVTVGAIVRAAGGVVTVTRDLLVTEPGALIVDDLPDGGRQFRVVDMPGA